MCQCVWVCVSYRGGTPPPSPLDPPPRPHQKRQQHPHFQVRQAFADWAALTYRLHRDDPTVCTHAYTHARAARPSITSFVFQPVKMYVFFFGGGGEGKGGGIRSVTHHAYMDE